MPVRDPLRLLPFLALALAACGASSSAADPRSSAADGGAASEPDGATAADPQARDDCEAHAERACANIESCPTFVGLYGTPEACRISIRALCEAEEMLSAGSGVADPKECSRARRAQRESCDRNQSWWIEACAPKGTRPNGAACGNDYACASGLCANGPSGACGTCADPLPEGAPCKLGGDRCAWGLACKGDVCAPMPRPGAACTAAGGCMYYPTNVGYGCPDDGVCSVANKAGSYAPENADCVKSICEGHLGCAPGFSCRPRLREGEPCTVTGLPCLVGLVCDQARGECVRRNTPPAGCP